MSISRLPTQLGFSFLSVPDLPQVTSVTDALDPFALPPSCKHVSKKGAGDSYVPVNYICPEAYALLAAAEASAARHADAFNAGAINLDMHDHGSTMQSALDGGYEPERVLTRMAPPKRYFRAFWRSVSFRLLKRWADTAKQSRKPGASPV